jgi:hypothetical protein
MKIRDGWLKGTSGDVKRFTKSTDDDDEINRAVSGLSVLVQKECLYQEHSFNGRMKREVHNVILFLDNATCHPGIDWFNVKLVPPPPPPFQHNFSYATYGSGCNLHTEILL